MSGLANWSPEVRVVLKLRGGESPMLPMSVFRPSIQSLPLGSGGSLPLNRPDPWQAFFGETLSGREWHDTVVNLSKLLLVASNSATQMSSFRLTPLGIQVARAIEANLANTSERGPMPAGPTAFPDVDQPASVSIVYICHTKSDNQICSELSNYLKSLGLQTWFDVENFIPGDSLVSKMNYGLEHSDYVIVVWSSAAQKSAWVKREYEAAITMETNDGKPRVIATRLDDTPLPALLRDKKYITATNGLEASSRTEIASALSRR